MIDLNYELQKPTTIIELDEPRPAIIRILGKRNDGATLNRVSITVTGRQIGIVAMPFGQYLDLIQYGRRCWVAKPVEYGEPCEYIVHYTTMLDPEQCPPWW